MTGIVIVVTYDNPGDPRKLAVFTEGVFTVAGMITDFLVDDKTRDSSVPGIKSMTIHVDVDYDDFQAGDFG